jgi:UDP-2,4-diacetamido-2,4,6-trideoxy-beta-L-altropyranose hydrolase
MGDVMGSLAIADEFRKRGYSVVFLIDNDIEAAAVIRETGFAFAAVELSAEENAWMSMRHDAVVVNQLNTPIEKLSVIKRHCDVLVTIDDTGKASRNLADLRINPLYYDKGAYCDPCYIPLHTVFKEAHNKPKYIHDTVRNLLVTLGGSDTYGLTPQIITALFSYPEEIDITVVVGPAFAHHRELNEALSNSKRNFNLFPDVNIVTMSHLMQRADIGICAAGNTLFEMACCGTPVIILCGEPFEEETAYRLENLGFGMVMPFSPRLDAELLIMNLDRLLFRDIRQAQSSRGRELIDGRGIHRIADCIAEVLKQAKSRMDV